MIAHCTDVPYLHALYDARTEVALENLRRYRDAVGDRIDTIVVSGTDYGTQKSEFFAPALFRDLYVPYLRRINDWIHGHTAWKTIYHTDGSVRQIMEDFITPTAACGRSWRTSSHRGSIF